MLILLWNIAMGWAMGVAEQKLPPPVVVPKECLTYGHPDWCNDLLWQRHVRELQRKGPPECSAGGPVQCSR